MEDSRFNCVWMTYTRKVNPIVKVTPIVINWSLSGDLTHYNVSGCNLYNMRGACKLDEFSILMYNPLSKDDGCPIISIKKMNVTINPITSTQFRMVSEKLNAIMVFSLIDGHLPVVCNSGKNSVLLSEEGLYVQVDTTIPGNNLLKMINIMSSRTKRYAPIDEELKEERRVDQLGVESELEAVQLYGDINKESAALNLAMRKMHRDICLTRYYQLDSLYKARKYQDYLNLLYLQPSWKYQIISEDEARITKETKKCVRFIEIQTTCGDGSYIKVQHEKEIQVLYLSNVTGDLNYRGSCKKLPTKEFYLPKCDGGLIDVITGKTHDNIDMPRVPQFNPMIHIQEEKPKLIETLENELSLGIGKYLDPNNTVDVKSWFSVLLGDLILTIKWIIAMVIIVIFVYFISKFRYLCGVFKK